MGGLLLNLPTFLRFSSDNILPSQSLSNQCAYGWSAKKKKKTLGFVDIMMKPSNQHKGSVLSSAMVIGSFFWRNCRNWGLHPHKWRNAAVLTSSEGQTPLCLIITGGRRGPGDRAGLSCWSDWCASSPCRWQPPALDPPVDDTFFIIYAQALHQKLGFVVDSPSPRRS